MKNKIYKQNIHDWFELTYSNFLVLHRSILQSMPQKWQEDFVKKLEEIEKATSKLKDLPASFWVRARSGNKFIYDPYRGYERGRRKIKLYEK